MEMMLVTFNSTSTRTSKMAPAAAKLNTFGPDGAGRSHAGVAGCSGM
jgi:hypothetical protein